MKGRTRIRTLVAQVAAGAVFGTAAAALSSVFAASGAWLDRIDVSAPTIVGLPAVWFLCVLTHECGHLAGGLVAGMRPSLLVAGPPADRLRR